MVIVVAPDLFTLSAMPSIASSLGISTTRYASVSPQA